MSELAKLALEEYNSEVTTAHHGGAAGRPFWNVNASQFMFNPNFQFPIIPGCKQYLFTATDCNKKIHSFIADSPISLLTPIWKDLPEGFVELKVEAMDEEGKPWTLAGARTFYKCAPFKGPENYPPKARSYRESALMAYRYVFNHSFIQHWLTHGTPDAEYDFYVYPSKTISSIVNAMIKYAKLDPQNAEEAIEIATKAADFLISISFGEDSPLPGLPPTYYVGYRENPDEYYNGRAVERIDNLMMLYPAVAGSAYLALEKATGEVRFFEAAKRIAEYYRKNVRDNGSWDLFLSVTTGEKIAPNYCVPDTIMAFMSKMYNRTDEEIWKKLEEGCFNYIVKNCLEPYNWEGQFEDVGMAANYSNLTHFCAEGMINYITNNKSDDKDAMNEAEDLMRYVEDQFVVWGNFAPWNRYWNEDHGADISEWFSPAGLEQYEWYVPIDSSTAKIAEAFLDLYKATKRPLLLSKACVLGDMLTRMQNPETGMIPTHWMKKSCIEDGGYLWINCHLGSANVLFYLAETTEE